jgi:hypothetical protein
MTSNVRESYHSEDNPLGHSHSASNKTILTAFVTLYNLAYSHRIETDLI